MTLIRIIASSTPYSSRAFRQTDRYSVCSMTSSKQTTAGRMLRSSLAMALLTGCGGLHPISKDGAGAYEASLRVLDEGFIIAWHDTRHGQAEVYARTLDATGQPRGPGIA